MMPTRAIFPAAMLARDPSGDRPIMGPAIMGPAIGPAIASAAVPPISAINCLRLIVPALPGWPRLAHSHGPARVSQKSSRTVARSLIAVRYFDDAGARGQRVDQRIGLGLVCSIEIGVPFVEQIDFR